MTLFLLLCLLVAVVSLVGAASYGLVRRVECKYLVVDDVMSGLGGCFGVFLLAFAPKGIGTFFLAVVLSVFLYCGGVAHRSSGGVSRDGLAAWMVMVVSAEVTLFVSVIPLVLLDSLDSRRVIALGIGPYLNDNRFVMGFLAAGFVSPVATAILWRMFQTLGLRPGVDRLLREGENLDENETFGIED